MARQLSLVSIKLEFSRALDSSKNLMKAVRPLCDRDFKGSSARPLHPTQARRVVALSFLAAVAAWEEFIGAAFVRYLAGARSPNGWAPTLSVGSAKSMEHVYQLLAGRLDFDPEKQFLNWVTEDVIRRSRLFLQRGNRIELAIEKQRAQLEDAAKIRNRIAHASRKCREDFNAVARRLRSGALHQGYTPGDLLLETTVSSFPKALRGGSIFESFIEIFSYLRDEVAP